MILGFTREFFWLDGAFFLPTLSGSVLSISSLPPTPQLWLGAGVENFVHEVVRWYRHRRVHRRDVINSFQRTLNMCLAECITTRSLFHKRFGLKKPSINLCHTSCSYTLNFVHRNLQTHQQQMHEVGARQCLWTPIKRTTILYQCKIPFRAITNCGNIMTLLNSKYQPLCSESNFHCYWPPPTPMQQKAHMLLWLTKVVT